MKVHFPLVVTVALVLAGCAQPPLGNPRILAAEAAHYGVSRELLLNAEEAGYFPRIHHNETLFCTKRATFSYIPRTQCLNTMQMTAQLQRSRSERRALQHRISTRLGSSSLAPNAG